MSARTFRYLIFEPGERPEFRLLVAYLFGQKNDVDTDGDSEYPASRSWTCLTMINRARPKERVDVDAVSEQPLILAVTSEVHWLAARMAYGLAVSTGGRLKDTDAHFLDAESLRSKVGLFDLDAAMARLRS